MNDQTHLGAGKGKIMNIYQEVNRIIKEISEPEYLAGQLAFPVSGETDQGIGSSGEADVLIDIILLLAAWIAVMVHQARKAKS